MRIFEQKYLKGQGIFFTRSEETAHVLHQFTHTYTCSSRVLRVLNLNVREATHLFFSSMEMRDRIYECYSEHESFTSTIQTRII